MKASKIRALARLLAVTTVWYFLATPLDPPGALTQVGPFASQNACESYRSQVTNTGAFTFPCWSSSQK